MAKTWRLIHAADVLAKTARLLTHPLRADRSRWTPYNALPAHLQAPEDTTIKGVRTMQKLLGLGYELVSADRAKGTALMPLSGLSEEQRQRWSA